MNSITNNYLIGILFKKISETIDQHRESKKHQFDNDPYPGATDEEVLDFIIGIPYFDEKLKDFLLGNLQEETIIISQTWENEFIKKTIMWSQSLEWLNGSNYFFNEQQQAGKQDENSFLKLPY